MRSRRLSVFLLSFAVAGLGYANWRVMQLDLDASPATVGVLPANALAIPALHPPLEPRPLSEFHEIVRRPLFTPSRRPPEAPEQSIANFGAAAPAEQTPPPEIKLLGVALHEDTRQALLRVPEQSEQWVREGEEIGGWLVESVSAGTVILVSGKQIQEVRLYPVRGTAAAAQ